MSTTSVNINAAQVKELRDKTNAPMMACKQALTEANGNVEDAIVILRKKGVAFSSGSLRPRKQALIEPLDKLRLTQHHSIHLQDHQFSALRKAL